MGRNRHGTRRVLHKPVPVVVNMLSGLDGSLLIDDSSTLVIDARYGPINKFYNNLNINDGTYQVLGGYPVSIGVKGTLHLGASGGFNVTNPILSSTSIRYNGVAPDGRVLSYNMKAQAQGGDGGEDGNDEGGNSGPAFGNGGGGSANYFGGQISAGAPTQDQGGTGCQAFSGEIAQGGTVDSLNGEAGPEDTITGTTPGGGAGAHRGAHGGRLFLKVQTLNIDSGVIQNQGEDGGVGGNGGNATSPDSDGIGGGGGGGGGGGNGGDSDLAYHSNIGDPPASRMYNQHGSGNSGGFGGSGNGGSDGQDGNGGANGVDGTANISTF